MEKGLFDSLFVFIMLVLLAPVASYQDSHVINEVSIHLNELSLTVDAIIADALSDQTKSNGCSLDSKVDYDSKLQMYLDNFEVERAKYTSITCLYLNLSSTLASGVYQGYIDINCSGETQATSVNITKRLYFKKTITANLSGLCDVNVMDNYSTEYYQVSRQQ